MSSKPFYPIRRTHSRRVVLILGADHPDKGPYYLIDRAGYGVSWRQPAHEIRPTGEISTSMYQGNPYSHKTTWIPIFNRAKLAFTLVEEDEELTPKEAKKIADATYARLGNGAGIAHAENFAWHLVEKNRKE